VARKMPKVGYYLFKDGSKVAEIIMVTGTTKGNKYMRLEFKSLGWADLLWTCVPAQAHLDANYEFHETEPMGWWTNNTLDHIVAGMDGGKRPEIPPPNPPKKKTASDDIKVELSAKTGIAKSRWTRLTKVKVGTPADVYHDPRKLGGYNLAKSFPEHVDHNARLFSACDGENTVYYAVFEEDDGTHTIKDATSHVDAFFDALWKDK
jgi:hypothetical protein